MPPQTQREFATTPQGQRFLKQKVQFHSDGSIKRVERQSFQRGKVRRTADLTFQPGVATDPSQIDTIISQSTRFRGVRGVSGTIFQKSGKVVLDPSRGVQVDIKRDVPTPKTPLQREQTVPLEERKERARERRERRRAVISGAARQAIESRDPIVERGISLLQEEQQTKEIAKERRRARARERRALLSTEVLGTEQIPENRTDLQKISLFRQARQRVQQENLQAILKDLEKKDAFEAKEGRRDLFGLGRVRSSQERLLDKEIFTSRGTIFRERVLAKKQEIAFQSAEKRRFKERTSSPVGSFQETGRETGDFFKSFGRGFSKLQNELAARNIERQLKGVNKQRKRDLKNLIKKDSFFVQSLRSSTDGKRLNLLKDPDVQTFGTTTAAVGITAAAIATGGVLGAVAGAGIFATRAAATISYFIDPTPKKLSNLILLGGAPVKGGIKLGRGIARTTPKLLASKKGAFGKGSIRKSSEAARQRRVKQRQVKEIQKNIGKELSKNIVTLPKNIRELTFKSVRSSQQKNIPPVIEIRPSFKPTVTKSKKQSGKKQKKKETKQEKRIRLEGVGKSLLVRSTVLPVATSGKIGFAAPKISGQKKVVTLVETPRRKLTKKQRALKRAQSKERRQRLDQFRANNPSVFTEALIPKKTKQKNLLRRQKRNIKKAKQNLKEQQEKQVQSGNVFTIVQSLSKRQRRRQKGKEKARLKKQRKEKGKLQATKEKKAAFGSLPFVSKGVQPEPFPQVTTFSRGAVPLPGRKGIIIESPKTSFVGESIKPPRRVIDSPGISSRIIREKPTSSTEFSRGIITEGKRTGASNIFFRPEALFFKGRFDRTGIPGIGTAPKTSDFVGSFIGSRPGSRVASKQRQGLGFDNILSQVTTTKLASPKQKRRTTSSFGLGFENPFRSPSRIQPIKSPKFSDPVPPPPMKPSVPPPPMKPRIGRGDLDLPDFSFDSKEFPTRKKKKRKAPKVTTKLGFSPSLEARFFNIRGNKPAPIITATGLFTRPIIKYNR